jgi:serine/arginine repetitive matrix protein 1
MRKVALDVIKPWITARVTEFMGFEDDVLSSYVVSLLDDENGTKVVDPRVLQINLGGFMEAHAAPFVERLWKLLLSAQTEVGGIPTEILEAKKAEIKKQLEEQQRIAAQVAAHHPPSQQQSAAPHRAVARYLGASKAEMEASAIGNSSAESHAEWQRRSEERERARQRNRSRSPRARR